MGKPGEERSFIHRLGGKIPRLRGARRECDPGALPIDRFRDVINGRFVGNELVSRGGQSKRTASALAGCITGIFAAEYQDATPVGGNNWSSAVFNNELYLGSFRGGTFGAPPYSWSVRKVTNFSANPKMFMHVQGGVLHFYDPLLNPTMQRYEGKVLEVARLTGGHNLSDYSSTGGSQSDLFSCMLGFGGSLFVGQRGRTAPLNGVYRLDGLVLVPDDVPPSEPGNASVQFLAELAGSLYAAWGGDGVGANPPGLAPGHPIIRKRTGAGSWSTLATFPNSTTVTHSIQDVAVYSGLIRLLVARTDYTGSTRTGGSIQLWTFDGVTLALARTVVTEVATPPTVAAGALRVFNGLLYYGWGPAGATALRLGTFDGVTYTDTHKDFTGIANQDVMKGHPLLREFNGNLCAIDDSFGYLVLSPGVNTAGAWTAIATVESAQTLVLDQL